MRHKDLRNRRPPPYNLLHFNREKALVSFQKHGTIRLNRPVFFLCLSATLKKPEMGVFSHTRIRVARLKQFHFSAFTLHPQTHLSDIQPIAGEQKALFCLHRGWIQKGETFTRIMLSLNKLGAKGEAVKEKNRKTPDARVYTRTREGAIFSGSSDIWGDGCRKEENRWANCRFPCVWSKHRCKQIKQRT